MQCCSAYPFVFDKQSGMHASLASADVEPDSCCSAGASFLQYVFQAYSGKAFHSEEDDSEKPKPTLSEVHILTTPTRKIFIMTTITA